MNENQAFLGDNSGQTRPSDVNYFPRDSNPRRLQTRRSTSSMTTVQSYSSASSTYFQGGYNPSYFPTLPANQSLYSSARQSSIHPSAGGYAMQSSRSLGGMTSSNANLPFPMPTYDMNHLQSLAPQALALSLGAFGTDPSLRSISQNPIPAPDLCTE